MTSALATLAQAGEAAATRRVAVLGAMRELGEHSERLHEALITPLLAAQPDAVFFGWRGNAPACRKGSRSCSQPAVALCAKPQMICATRLSAPCAMATSCCLRVRISVGIGALLDDLKRKEAVCHAL